MAITKELIQLPQKLVRMWTWERSKQIQKTALFCVFFFCWLENHLPILHHTQVYEIHFAIEFDFVMTFPILFCYQCCDFNDGRNFFFAISCNQFTRHFNDYISKYRLKMSWYNSFRGNFFFSRYFCSRKYTH